MQSFIVLRHGYETKQPLLSKTMNKRTSPKETDVDVRRASVVLFRIRTLRIEGELANYGTHADVTMSIARNEIRVLIVKKASHIYAAGT